MKTFRRALAVLVLTASVLGSALSPAAAFRGGTVDDPARRNPALHGPTGRTYLLNNGWDTRKDASVAAGNYYDRTYVGDFDGDGRDTIAVRRGRTYTLGRCTVAFGRVNDQAFVGDWDGDGTDTLAVRRGATIVYTNTPCGRTGEGRLAFGRADDTVLVGDWDGDGKDSFAVRRGNVFHLKEDLRTGRSQRRITYGRANDTVLVGDWDGNGTDTFAVRRGNVFHVKNRLTGAPERSYPFGRATDAPIVGDWDGDGTDTPGLRRPEAIPRPRSEVERIAAQFGMSVRSTAKDNPCKSSTAVGCFGPSMPYMWVGHERRGVKRTAAEQVRTAWHEVAHLLQYRACGRMDLPRLEPGANAIADQLQRARKPYTGTNAVDARNARAVISGNCPF